MVLVCSADALHLCRDKGYQALPPQAAVECIEQLAGRDMTELRSFVARARLGSFMLKDVGNRELMAMLREWVRSGSLSVIREGELGAGAEDDRTTSKGRRLVREIEAKSRQRLSHGGRQYRLVVDVDLERLPNRDSYEVVGRARALVVLRGLAEESGQELAPLLAEAGSSLTQDWRPPFSPDGLVLLQRILYQQAARPEDGPALTPSQVKKLTTVAIELVDDTGNPVPGEPWELVLPDGSKRSGQLDENGQATVTSVPDGECHVQFPRLDADAWSPSGSQPL